MHPARLQLEGTAEPQLRELDVLLVLLVVMALDLDPGLETDRQTLDRLVHGPALDPHLTLDDAAGYDVDLGQHRLDRSPTGPQAREQPLEPHVFSSSGNAPLLFCPDRILDPYKRDPAVSGSAHSPWQDARSLTTPYAVTPLYYARTP